MSLYVEQGPSIVMPETGISSSIDAVAELVLRQVTDTVPYVDNGEYMLPRALKVGGGCCIAQALAGLEILQANKRQAGVVFGDGHAYFLLKQDDEIRFVDPLPTRSHKGGIIRPINDESRRQLGYGLNKLYAESLAPALDKGSFIHYYYQKEASISGPWNLKRPRKIRGETNLSEHNSPHIIVDAPRGKKMLSAIGDITRLKAKHREDFPSAVQDRFNKLVSLIPDFLNPLEPLAIEEV